MMTTYLEPKDIPHHLIGSYTGRKFKAEARESVTVPSYAGNWSGGSRDTFTVVRLSDGQLIQASDNQSAPWDSSRQDRNIELCPGIAVVRHSIFDGKDMGLTFYVHPADIAALLPAPIELTRTERLVLKATKSFKSSYNGRDRYQMMEDDCRWQKDTEAFPSREQWESAKSALIERKLLNKAGAITAAGKNAIS